MKHQCYSQAEGMNSPQARSESAESGLPPPHGLGQPAKVLLKVKAILQEGMAVQIKGDSEVLVACVG